MWGTFCEGLYRLGINIFDGSVLADGVRGRVLFLLAASAEEEAENQTDKGPAVKQLVADGHREIKDKSFKPEAKGWVVLEKQSGNQAHGWAHDAANTDGNGKGDELGPVCGLHEGKSQFPRQLSYNKEFQDKSNGPHDGELFCGGQEGGTGYFTGIQRNVVNNHAKYHKAAHQEGENNVFKFVFGHKKSAFLWDSKLIVTNMCCFLSSAGRKYRFQFVPYVVFNLIPWKCIT